MKNPLFYRERITKRSVLETVFFLWILPTAISIGPLVGMGEFRYNAKIFVCEQGWVADNKGASICLPIFGVSSFIVPLAVLIKLNYAVFKVAHRQSKVIKSVQLQMTTSEKERTRLQKILTEYRAAIDVTFIVGVFLLCFLPPWVAGVSRRILGKDKVPALAYLVTNNIYASSAVWNPFIYSVRKREFRKAAISLLRCRRNDSDTGREMRRIAFDNNTLELNVSNLDVTVGSPAVSIGISLC